MQNTEQILYIALDDSGKMSSKEHYCTYGGIVFFSKKERDKFITQYKSILKKINCKYCKQNRVSCNKLCPEVKSFNASNADRRWMMNYIKKYFTISFVIDNTKVFPYIMEHGASKGRFFDYCIKRLVKETIKNLIETHKINPELPLKMILEMDEQTTKSNGYYNLKEGILEEFIYGISNFNYYQVMTPILKDLKIDLGYRNSKKCIVIQASDFIAGTVRKTVLGKSVYKDLSFLNQKVFFP